MLDCKFDSTMVHQNKTSCVFKYRCYFERNYYFWTFYSLTGLLMKKILSLALVFVFFYSIIGFYLNFEIEQYQVKEAIKEKIIKNLPDNELTLVKISSGDYEKITWTEEGNEFRYNGNMLDVVKIRTGADTTYYYCFNDEKESKLFADLDKLVREQTDNSQSRTNQKKQDITYLFYEPTYMQCLAETPVLYFSYPSRYKSICTDVLSPPPRKINLG